MKTSWLCEPVVDAFIRRYSRHASGEDARRFQ